MTYLWMGLVITAIVVGIPIVTIIVTWKETK